MKHLFLSLVAIALIMMGQTANVEAQSLQRLVGKGISAATSKMSEKTVKVDAIPQTVEEFAALQQELATEPEGAVMMVILAMEVYNQNHSVGEECIRMANVDINFSSMYSRVRDLFNGDSSSRPYQVATFFKGATPRNAYNPTKPYTIRVRQNPAHRTDERSQSLRGYVKYLQVYSSGFDNSWLGVEVVKQKGCDVYKVSNCPAIYMRCKEIDFESDDEYQGL